MDYFKSQVNVIIQKWEDQQKLYTRDSVTLSDNDNIAISSRVNVYTRAVLGDIMMDEGLYKFRPGVYRGDGLSSRDNNMRFRIPANEKITRVEYVYNFGYSCGIRFTNEHTLNLTITPLF